MADKGSCVDRESGDKISEKTCKGCFKKVAAPMICGKCGAGYHPSCAARAKVITDKDEVNCCAEIFEVRQENVVDPSGLKDILQKEFREFRDAMEKTYKDEMAELKKAMDFMSEHFEAQKREYIKLNNMYKDLTNENAQLKEKVEKLEEKQNEVEQVSKICNLIMTGIPKQAMPVSKIAQGVAKAMGITLQDTDIEDAYRVKKTEDAPILIKLVNKQLKADLIKKRREVKSLYLRECKLEGENKMIYLNDDLTYANQDLFRRARAFGKSEAFKFVYCIEGRIYIKKNEGDPPIRIRREMDLTAARPGRRSEARE